MRQVQPRSVPGRAAVSLLATLVLGSGCEDLPTLSPRTCGNGVVEAEVGEQCDLFPDPTLGAGLRCAEPSDALRACRYVCSRSNPEEGRCPSGWGCSADGVCRFGSGRFEESEGGVAATIPFTRLDLTDVDGDGRRDLLAAGRTGVAVHFASRTGDFSASSRLAVLHEPSALSLGDMDGDGRSDLMLSTQELAGFPTVFQGRRDRSLAPLLSSITGTWPRGRDVLRGASHAQAVALRGEPCVGSLLVTVTVRGGEVSLELAEVPDSTPVELGPLPSAAPPAVARVVHGGAEHLVVALPGSRSAALVRIDCSPALPTLRIDPLELPAEVTTPREALGGGPSADPEATPVVLVADIDGDDDDDLLFPVRAPGNDAGVSVAISRASEVGFGPARLDRAFVAATWGTGAASPWPLAAGRLDGDALADYVFPTGVFVARRTAEGLSLAVWPRTQPRFLYPFAAALLSDLDGDGEADVATSGAQLPGVELYLSTRPATLPVYVPTRAMPTALRAVDLDDLPGKELVFLERGSLGLTTLSTLHGRDLDYASVEGVDRIVAVDALPGRSGSADILVITTQTSPTEEFDVALLFRLLQRQLASPIALRAEYGVGSAQRAFGRFTRESGVLELALVQDSWAMVAPLDGRGQLGEPDQHRFAVWAELFPELDMAGALCRPMAVGNVDPASKRDELLIVARPSCRGPIGALGGAGVGGGHEPADALLVVGWADDAGAPVGARLDLPPETGRVSDLALEDLDANGLPELRLSYGGPGDDVVSAGPSAQLIPEGAGIVILWDLQAELSKGAASLTYRDITRVAAEPNAFILDAVALQTDGDPALELAVLTGRNQQGRLSATIRVVRALSSGEPAWGDPVISWTPTALATPALVSADVDQDGLDDLLLGEGTSVAVYRSVPSGPAAR